MTSPGRPSVVARCGRNPVPKIDAILKYGQPSAQVLSYESAADEVDGVAGAREHVANEPDPAEPAAGDDQDRRDRGDPPVAGQTPRERPDHERQDGREERAGGEVDGDDVEAGHGRGDRAVEVGEPVVGQRHAGEVGHLRREVAGRDARADGDVDQQVAPVPAAAHPAIGRLDPAVDAEDSEDDEADGGGDDPGREVGPERGDEAGPGRALERARAIDGGGRRRPGAASASRAARR